MPFGLTRRIAEPRITNERELKRYVVRITLFAFAVALAIDVVNQLVFFTDWEHCIRSWILTTGVVSAIAIPVTLSIGRAHLNLYRQKQEMEQLSRTDPLTGLPNRRALMEAGETGTFSFMVLVIVDIDRFKRINDTYGHRIGDIVLQTVSSLMAAELGTVGMVGRLGGEEFALFSSAPSVDAIIAHLARFRERVADLPIVVEQSAVTVTISAGAALRQGDVPLSDLYSRADEALYAAKMAGRNCIRLSPGLLERCSPETRQLVGSHSDTVAS